jgi:hypothetical protein
MNSPIKSKNPALIGDDLFYTKCAFISTGSKIISKHYALVSASFPYFLTKDFFMSNRMRDIFIYS